jgi:hypothetical protein
VDAIAVVHHCEVTDTFGIQANDRALLLKESGRFSSNREFWPGSSFFSWLPVPSARKKSNLAQNQKCSRSFKSSTEDSKQLGKIENCGRTFKSSAERWAFRWKFETARGQLKSSAEKLSLPLKLGDVRGKFKSPAGGRTPPAKI